MLDEGNDDDGLVRADLDGTTDAQSHYFDEESTATGKGRMPRQRWAVPLSNTWSCGSFPACLLRGFRRQLFEGLAVSSVHESLCCD